MVDKFMKTLEKREKKHLFNLSTIRLTIGENNWWGSKYTIFVLYGYKFDLGIANNDENLVVIFNENLLPLYK
jgi:hypothetical protein